MNCRIKRRGSLLSERSPLTLDDNFELGRGAAPRFFEMVRERERR